MVGTACQHFGDSVEGYSGQCVFTCVPYQILEILHSKLLNGYICVHAQTRLDGLHVPYSYGWSIIALTAGIKLLTFPLTKQQVESSLAMQNLKPEIDKIKEKYGDDKDAVSRETSALYKKADVNPLAGCLPSVATIPVFIGLYRSLTSVANEGALDNQVSVPKWLVMLLLLQRLYRLFTLVERCLQGFYWIPSLAGPTTLAAQKAGAGTAWLFPFVDGAPPIGWELASHYLVSFSGRKSSRSA